MTVYVTPPLDKNYFFDKYLIDTFGATYTTAPANIAAVPGGKKLVVLLKEHNTYFPVGLVITTDQELAEVKIDPMLISEATTRIWMLVPTAAALPATGNDTRKFQDQSATYSGSPLPIGP